MADDLIPPPPNPRNPRNLRKVPPVSTQTTAPPKRYRIGELAQFTGLSRQTLHNYTQWGLIHELEWTPGGHRVYGEEAFTRLRRIIELKRTCSMKEIRQQLPPPKVCRQTRNALGVIS